MSDNITDLFIYVCPRDSTGQKWAASVANPYSVEMRNDLGLVLDSKYTFLTLAGAAEAAEAVQGHIGSRLELATEISALVVKCNQVSNNPQPQANK